uniref:DRG5 n=1 Tax=Pyropia tenera TaxID=2785 RepID=A0A1W6GBQ3_PYRTE|nr:DRG5 [Neopyropia tenera]
MKSFRAVSLAAAVAVAALAAVAAPAATAASSVSPVPTPKTMKITKKSGEECISKWYVTGKASGGGWEWKDETKCCPPRMATKTMTTYVEGKKCLSTWTVCDRELNAAGNCVWKWCDKTDCATPVCPPKPAEMKKRYTKKDGRRCVSRWFACGTQIKGGVCTYKGCDVVTCKAACVKPAPKTMTTRTPTKVCVSHWWAAKLNVDQSTDGQDCNWVWADKEECTCKPADKSPVWKKC